jgi:hypothetical protein
MGSVVKHIEKNVMRGHYNAKKAQPVRPKIQHNKGLQPLASQE